MKTMRIKIIFHHDTNRRLLDDWVQDNYTLVDPESDAHSNVDLIIVDRDGLAKHHSTIGISKQEASPLFLPVLLITNQKTQQEAVWQLVDNVLESPINLSYLKLQVDVLLRTRQLSRTAFEQSQKLTRLNLGIESSGDAIIIVENSHLSHINQSAIDIFGIEPGNTDALSYLKTIDTEEQALAIAIQQVTENPVQAEMMLRNNDGIPIPMLVRINRIAGHDHSYIISCTNISKQKEAQASGRRQRLLAEILQETAMTLTATLNTREVFDRILDSIGRLIPIQAAAICLIENGFASITHSQGYLPLEIDMLGNFFAGHPLHTLDFLQGLIQHGHIIELYGLSPMRVRRVSSGGSLIITPIILNADNIGLILVEHGQSESDEAISKNHLKAFAAQAAIAIQNARLYARSQSMAVIEERERLARDFHDSVTQTLFSASVIAEAITRSAYDVPPETIELLNELHLLTRGALAETRTLLLELKPTKLLETDLPDLLRQLAESIWSRKQITLNVDLSENSSVPLRIKVAFYRIAQEAFHNIVKHSNATRVDLNYRGKQDQAVLLIADNGIGFEFNNGHGLGLSNMRQRAENIQARFEINSKLDHGTTIQIRWHNQEAIGDE